MNKIKYFLALSLLFSCSVHKPSPDRDPPSGVHPVLQQYLDDYLSLSGNPMVLKRAQDLHVGFKPLPGNTVGLCRSWPHTEYMEIEISPSFWRTTTPSRREALMFHEFTHCLCERDHNHAHGVYTIEDKNYRFMESSGFDTPEKGYFHDQCPTSIMHPALVNTICYQLHKDHYLMEMFQKCLNP